MAWQDGRRRIAVGTGAGACTLALALGAALVAAPLAAGRAAAQDFAGNGPAETRPIPLPAGAVPFEVRHEGSGHYRFQLVDAGGRLVQQLLDGSGMAEGSGELRVPAAGDYRIAVTGSGPWAIHLHPPAADVSTAAAAPPPGAGSPDTAAVPAGEQGRRDGLVAGRAAVPWSWGWFGTGLAGGLLTGPVGATLATVAAGRGEVRVPGDRGVPGTRGPDYARGWRMGFVSGAIGSRRESALVGGLAGTLVWGWAILKLTHLGAQGGTTGTVGGPPPNAVLVGIRF